MDINCQQKDELLPKISREKKREYVENVHLYSTHCYKENDTKIFAETVFSIEKRNYYC
jgi:hypothetical protein